VADGAQRTVSGLWSEFPAVVVKGDAGIDGLVNEL
jgi:hypothetical protein